MTRTVAAGTYYVRVKAWRDIYTGDYAFVSSFSTTASNTPQSDRVVLLLHGLNSDPTTWDRLITNRYDGRCSTVFGGVFTENNPTLDGEACFAVRFGSQDWPSHENWHSPEYGLKGIRCDNISTGCKGDYTRIFNNGENDLGVEVRQAINRIRLLKGAGVKIVLLGHSRGGLAARAALQSPYEYGHDLDAVVGLITTGTPHNGSPFGKIYRYLADNCFSNGGPVYSGSCLDDWEAAVDLRDRIPNADLDIQKPALNFLSPLSNDIQAIANTKYRLIARGLEIKMLSYTGQYLGHLGTGYSAWEHSGGQGYNQFSEQSKRYILCDNVTTCSIPPCSDPIHCRTEYDVEFLGDGIVPLSSQAPSDIGGVNTTPDNSGSVYHVDEPKRVNDLNAALNGLRWQ
jgi:pimeloyl-ACP methyl ester carboxylesterase